MSSRPFRKEMGIVKTTLFIVAFWGLMSVGAWTCKASFVLQDDRGFYYPFTYMCDLGDRELYSVGVYFGADRKYMASGLLIYDPAHHVIKILVFGNQEMYSNTIEAEFNGWPTPACWCNENLATGNTWLDLLSWPSIKSSSPLPAGTVGTQYSFAVQAEDGHPPYTFTASGLPPGLGMQSSGTLSGTPTSEGTYPLSVSVTDAANQTGSKSFTLVINPQSTTNWAGTWSGSYQYSFVGTGNMTYSSTGTMTMTLDASGDGSCDLSSIQIRWQDYPYDVVGYYPASGTIDGEISGGIFEASFSGSTTPEGIAVHFTCTGTRNGNTIAGPLAMYDHPDSGSFSVIKP